MLIALNATATRVAAEDATRSDRYRCPACHDDVTLKQERTSFGTSLTAPGRRAATVTARVSATWR